MTGSVIYASTGFVIFEQSTKVRCVQGFKEPPIKNRRPKTKNQVIIQSMTFSTKTTASGMKISVWLFLY